jgi:SAM-dependent methyltransferase
VEQDFYSRYYEYEDSHWWFLGRRQVFLRLLDRYFAPAADGRELRILDVGCGTGTMLRELRRYGRVKGVDADEQAVRLCRRRGIEDVEQVSPGPLPFDDGSFDLVTALDVVEHVDDDVAMLRELRRVLAPGGTLLVSVPAFAFLWGAQDEIAHHKRRYRAPELRERLLAAGFEIRRLSYFNSLLFPPIAAIRVLRPFKPGSTPPRSDFEMTKPGRLNAVLARVFAAEAPLVERMDLPVGVSIVALGTGAERREPR